MTLAKKIARLAQVKKASDILIMNIGKLTSMTDYFVVCSADSDIQAVAIADSVEEGMEKEGVRVWHREVGSKNWIILDYVDVVLHVFHKQTRSFYSLERLWGDAEVTHVADEVAPAPRRLPRKPRASRTRIRNVKKGA
jgi:ribosome-associated protein